MKTLSLEQMETTEGGRFWGEEISCDDAGCWVYTCRFWICHLTEFI